MCPFQEINIQLEVQREEVSPQADSVWEALATLPNLIKCRIDFCAVDEGQNDVPEDMFACIQHVSLLTRLRCNLYIFFAVQ